MIAGRKIKWQFNSKHSSSYCLYFKSNISKGAISLIPPRFIYITTGWKAFHYIQPQTLGVLTFISNLYRAVPSKMDILFGLKYIKG